MSYRRSITRSMNYSVVDAEIKEINRTEYNCSSFHHLARIKCLAEKAFHTVADSDDFYDVIEQIREIAARAMIIGDEVGLPGRDE